MKILKSDRQFEELKQAIRQQDLDCSDVIFDEAQVPPSYPCIVKWFEEHLEDVNMTPEQIEQIGEFVENDDFEGMEEMEIPIDTVALYRFIFITKQEIVELLEG